MDVRLTWRLHRPASPETAENHRSRMMRNLAVRSTAEVVQYAARQGLLP